MRRSVCINDSPKSPADRFQYAYERDGNVLYKNNLVNSNFSELYHAKSTISTDDNAAYDNLNRLITFRRGTLSSSGNNGSGLDSVTGLNGNSLSSQVWTLDAVGNQTAVNNDNAVTAQTSTLNSQNEETGFGSSTLTFDSNGNTTIDDQGHTLVYDAWNRLVAVKNGGTTLVAYGYDATGNRITRTATGTTDFYNSAAGQVLEERQAGTTTNQYVWSLAYVNTPVLRDDNTSAGSYGRTGSGLGQRIYVQEDANENVTALTDASGNVLERFVYSPYGVATVIGSTTAWATASDTLSWVYTFQGGRYDATSGMIHFGAREYSPTLARWVQKDPAGYMDGANRYLFTFGNPTIYVDFRGTTADNPSNTESGPDLLSALETIDSIAGTNFAASLIAIINLAQYGTIDPIGDGIRGLNALRRENSRVAEQLARNWLGHIVAPRPLGRIFARGFQKCYDRELLKLWLKGIVPLSAIAGATIPKRAFDPILSLFGKYFPVPWGASAGVSLYSILRFAFRQPARSPLTMLVRSGAAAELGLASFLVFQAWADREATKKCSCQTGQYLQDPLHPED